MHKLFVYGTLKTGKGVTGFIHAELHDLGAFPAVINVDNTEEWVKGEIIEVEEKDFKRIDGYEGVPHLYIRKKAKFFDINRDPTDIVVWVYEFAKVERLRVQNKMDCEEWLPRHERQ
jgi:gamma-glutamylcyclotransferase (GGCT)/AIG2-like uncharacterized protein YtfP